MLELSLGIVLLFILCSFNKFVKMDYIVGKIILMCIIGVIMFCVVICIRYRCLLVIFVEIWIGIVVFWFLVFLWVGVFNDLMIW